MDQTWTVFTFALLSVLAAPAAAQDTAAPSATAAVAPLKDKEAVTFNEVERGVYFGITAGPLFILNAPESADGAAASKHPHPFSQGQTASLEIGLDFGTRISVSVFVMGTINSAGSDYFGNPPANSCSHVGCVSGDFSSIIPGASVRANLVGFPDSQGTDRTWIYVRAAAGYVTFFPHALLGGERDILVSVSPGLEYYTRLRHFSIGLEVTGTAFLPAASFGFAVTPNLRYAF